MAYHCTQNVFFMASVFDSHGFPNLILFLVIHVSSEQNISFNHAGMPTLFGRFGISLILISFESFLVVF